MRRRVEQIVAQSSLHARPEVLHNIKNVPLADIWLSRRARLPTVMPAHPWYVFAQIGFGANGTRTAACLTKG